MAPREATGHFPDQYIAFDYETALPVGLPPQHDPAPLGLDSDGADNDPDMVQQSLNHVDSGTQSATDPHRPSSGTGSPVDPLSIDPTMDQSTQTADHPNNSILESYFPVNPFPGVYSPSGGRPFSSMSVESSMAIADNSSSPISTGSSYLHTSTAPNSPLSALGSSNTTAVGQRRTQQQPRTTSVPRRSVFDSLGSIEMEEDEPQPSLEQTFDSSTSFSVVGASYIRQVSVTEGSDSNSGHDSEVEADQQQISPTSSEDSNESLRMLYRNTAFDDVEPPQSPAGNHSQDESNIPSSPNSIMLTFGPNTTVADLKYFAERGCIVALLQALNTPRLITLGTRMLADYAKMSHRRVAVASNRRILEFIQRTLLQECDQPDWLGREYAVETVRSLTATEESDRFLMGTHGLLNTLALVARGGPFAADIQENGIRRLVPLASEKAQLHACIAIMNLSCGKANKIEIAKIPDVLEAMRDVMMNQSEEARLKATTCVKNLSNADANDVALLGTPGLLESLAHVAATTCSPFAGATPCTTNACLALMNLSISKTNKHRVFRTPGVMDALMIVLERTTAQGSSTEARVKACSALSNLAIGYDNKIPMFQYPGFVDSILNVIQTDTGEARTKACSILWSFAAEMKNQVPVVQRGDILPVLVKVAEEDATTEARFKCVAALTLLAESLDNAIPLLEAGALAPLMDILHDAGPDPTQWKGQTASWCVGFLMNIAQSDNAVLALREAGVVELLAPLLTLDHYQSLKAAMAVTFCCRFDEGDECYDLLRKTENVIPKIVSLLHNTLSGRGGNGYKYGVFTLRSSVGCISALASGPDFMKERIATSPVFESLLRVVTDFCVDGGSPGAIVGGGRDDGISATLAIRALQSLTAHIIPIAGSSTLPFGQSMEDRLIVAFESFEQTSHPDVAPKTVQLATDAKIRIQGGRKSARRLGNCTFMQDTDDIDMADVASMASHCCGLDTIPGFGEHLLQALALPSLNKEPLKTIARTPSIIESESSDSRSAVRTFLLADAKTGRRYVVPTDPSGGRRFNDSRVWCYRRGRFCMPGEQPDSNYVWTEDLQHAYETALAGEQDLSSRSSSGSFSGPSA